MKLPRGFVASGVRAGIRKKGPDVALLVAKKGANAAAVFTKNKFLAAPVVLSRAGLKRSGGRLKGVVVNAGCANAITGVPGMEAARRVRQRAAEILGCVEYEVFVASTGVIGVVLPDQKIRAVLPGAHSRLSASGLDAASRAILTTDRGPKVAQASFTVGGRRGRIVGMAKGAGMIHPNMATMLGFLMTDAVATPLFLNKCLRRAVDQSFNAVSVDGDTSTNDTVLLMASGALGGPELTSAEEGEYFFRALEKVCRDLAFKIVSDGEGASRVLGIEIRGAHNERDARAAAHAVGTSPLVKTALNGGDPNWGRILAAVGRSGARVAPGRVSLRIGPLWIVRDGTPLDYREKDAARLFSRERVEVIVDLGVGKAAATLLTCDLGHDYVSANTDYRS